MAKSAIEVLKADHKKVKELLTQLAETTPRAAKKRARLLEEIETELMIHTTIEEEIFYPAFKEAGEGESKYEKIYFEAMEEHRAAGELVLPDLRETEIDSDKFSGRAKVLKELVEHHAEEEESEMFALAKEVFSRAELLNLGKRLEQRKKELQAG